MIGWLPNRNASYDTRFPVHATSLEQNWNGYLPFAANPWVLNPGMQLER